ncbi:hypothetical protein [Abyssisolibacter fermentans]|uniref:hypothetical protein n=1 Tax=Abyssisolibacter fermentans TaxID=1766203 RepID=UPI0009E976F9|nr:hypothetical protein [Abyssisolibacter fermentans]
MNEFMKEWFSWFEEGIELLDEAQVSVFFSKCAENCVNRGVLGMYREFYSECGNDLDIFFESLSDKNYGSGYVIEPQNTYELVFSECTCELNKLGYVSSDCICECSRQSILHIMQSLKNDAVFEVDKLSTILGGNSECRFRIKIK